MELHDHATFSEKVRGAFDELDQHRQRGITKEEWSIGMKKLRIEVMSTDYTVTDLFDKLDLNRDGLLSFSEFQRFAELYPTMLDSIYYRSKDYWTDIQQLESIDKAKSELAALQDREDDSITALREAQRHKDSQEQKVHVAENLIIERRAEEEAAQRSLKHAEEATSMGRQAVTAKAEDVVRLREEEREWESRVIECQRSVEQLVDTLKHHDADVAASEERLRSIERMLIEQKREVEARIQARDHVQYEVLTCQGREQAAHSQLVEAQMLVQNAIHLSQQAEADVAAMMDAERAAAAKLSFATGEVLKAQAAKDAEYREFQNCKEREIQRATIVESARAATEAHLNAIRTLEQRNVEFNHHRRSVEGEEAPLLDQEALLREQRDSLEERENKLRSDVHVFTSHTGRSPATSPRVGHKYATAVPVPSMPVASPSPSHVLSPPYARAQRAEPIHLSSTPFNLAAHNLSVAVAAAAASASSYRDSSTSSFSPSRLRATALAASRHHY